MAVIGGQGDCLFAVGDAAVPLAQSEVGAAKQIVGDRIIRRLLDLSVQRGNGFIDMPRCQHPGNALVGASYGWSCKQGENNKRKQTPHINEQLSPGDRRVAALNSSKR